MMTGGFAGKILLVDLTTGETAVVPIDPLDAEQYLGGLGLNLKLASDHLKPGVDALDPENVIVLGVGPLVGTGLPSTSRVFAVSRLPSGKTIGWCGAGGVNWGCQLKNAGIDHIIIKGRADKPVSLYINDGKAMFLDAESLWGLGVDDTCETLWKQFAPPAGILAIGPAGENRVSFSMAFIDRIATLGRGGLGAVMGSKNLKAIVVRGTGGVKVADRKHYKALNESFINEIRNYPYLKEWQDQGMIKSFPLVPPELYKQIKKRRIACVSCPIGCKDVVEIPDGEFAGTIAHSSSVINLFTPQIYGFKDYRESIRLIMALDQYGIDAFEFFGIMGFVKTLVEKGLILKADIKPEIELNSLSSLLQWAKKIAFRQGLGDCLAGGFRAIIDQFGTESEACAPAMIRGMHPYTGPGSALPWKLFGTMELGQMIDPRGPHVGSGGSPTYFAKRPIKAFFKHFQRMGIPDQAVQRIVDASDPLHPQLNIGRLLKYSHCWFAILGSMGICVRGQVNRFYSATRCADLYQAVTGIPTDLNQLRERAERVWTLYLTLNNIDSTASEQEMMIPKQWLKTGGFQEYVTEKPLSEEGIREMVRGYYDEWEKAGCQAPEALS